MKTPRRTTGSILSEALILLVFAGVVGTTVHLVRTDQKRKIAFLGKHNDCFTIRKKADTAPAPAVTSGAKIEPLPDLPMPPIASSTPPERPQQTEPPKPPHPPVEGVREIDFDEALRLHKDEAPFLDARRSRFYDAGHIPNARPFSVWEADLDQKIDALTKELPLEMALVIYCSSGDCEDSHNLATKLKLAGYKDLLIFKGGFPEWAKRKLPVEKTPGAPDAGPGDDEAAKEEAKK